MRSVVHRLRPLPSLSLVLAICLLAGSLASGASAQVPPGPKLERLPEFSVVTLDGKKLAASDLRGKVVLLDFWATWCVPCHVQTKILEPIHKEHGGKGVQILAANVGEEAATVRKFLEKKPVPYPVLMDPGEVSAELGVMALPALMVIDKKGRVSFFQQGLVDDSTLRRAIQQAGS